VARPDRIDFRVVRGPVPHVIESFVLDAVDEGTRLTWERAVLSSLEAVVVEAERRDRGRDSASEEEGRSSPIS
jgi:hypothetical protein